MYWASERRMVIYKFTLSDKVKNSLRQFNNFANFLAGDLSRNYSPQNPDTTTNAKRNVLKCPIARSHPLPCLYRSYQHSTSTNIWYDSISAYYHGQCTCQLQFHRLLSSFISKSLFYVSICGQCWSIFNPCPFYQRTSSVKVQILCSHASFQDLPKLSFRTRLKFSPTFFDLIYFSNILKMIFYCKN